MKRVFDVLISVLIIIALFPFWLFVALKLYFLYGIDNIIFKQQRIGASGVAFNIFKFQSMSNEKDGKGKLLSDELRTTLFGKVLRKSSFDEIPQLINVIKGDMSLVGPRPLLPKYLHLYTDQQNRRHEVKPGITGWAQVNGRNNISWKKKFELDVWYVDNQSMMLDTKILWMTILKVINRRDITTDDPKAFQPFNGNN